MDESTRRRRRLDLLVRMALEVRGCTRRELALCIGRDASNLVGVRALPKIDVARGLAEVLGWPVDAVAEMLLRGDGRAAEPSKAVGPRPTRGGAPAGPPTGLLAGPPAGLLAGARAGLLAGAPDGPSTGGLEGSPDGPPDAHAAALAEDLAERAQRDPRASLSDGRRKSALDLSLATFPGAAQRGVDVAQQGQRSTPGDHPSEIAGFLAEVAELQLAGWHGPAAQRLAQHLDGGVEVRLPLPDVVSILAACRLWAGAALEALALLSGAPGCAAAGGGDVGGCAKRRPGRAAEARSGVGQGGGQERSLSTVVIEALALAELTQHRLVDPGTARQAVLRAAELCTAPLIRSAATPLWAMGLRPQRVQPMLRGIESALHAMESGGSPEQAIARCEAGFVEGPEPVLVGVAHELLAIGRWACAEAALQRRRSPDAAAQEGRSRSTRAPRAGLAATSRAEQSAWALHERVGSVMPCLRAIVDRLADWPLRRRWLRLEHARRQLARARDQPLPPWAARGADLEMIAGIIARYPDDTDAACDLLDEARLVARERCPRLARSHVGWRGGGVLGTRGEQRMAVGVAAPK